MRFSVITLFPELIEAWAKTGLVGAAIQKKLASVSCTNPRDFTADRHKTVDDTAFGGTDGMVLKFEPLAKSIESLFPSHVVFLTPQGEPWRQATAFEWRERYDHVTLVCGRYAGFDQRLIEVYADAEVSVGDYVLNGGEVAGLAVMESLIRLLPGVLGNEESAVHESFSGGVLEAPVFTRPREVGGLTVPAPLLSGNHAEIERFERDLALVRTRLRRPEWTLPESELKSSIVRLKKIAGQELKSLGLSLEMLEQMEREKP